MKRHNGLIPLSWEHHTGLVFARRIEKGIKLNTDLDVIKSYLVSGWESHLSVHFGLEDSILNPSIKDEHRQHSFFLRLESDHKQITDLFTQIKNRAPDSKDLSHFAFLLSEHIRFEEECLFPWIEGLLSEKTLNQIGENLREESIEFHPDWPVKFWAENK